MLYNQIHGVLVLNKAKGLTSAQLVAKIKNKFKLNKVGHGGTLDPLATGVLPICINQGTKMARFLLESDKIYEGSFLLGVETDTQDMTGKVVAKKEVRVSDEQILSTMEKYLGAIDQIPPMYSAIKRHGKPLYRYARENLVLERSARRISIFEFKFIKREGDEIFFRVHCSKGTYVRTLCHDVGQVLGVGAALKDLSRLKTGELYILDSIDFDSLNVENLTSAPHWKSIEFLKTYEHK